MNIGMLWKRDKLWALGAGPSDEVEDRRLGARRVGVAMCFHPILRPRSYWHR